MNENSILTGRRFIESSLISAEYAVICPQRRNLRFSRFQIWLHTQCVMIFRADTNSETRNPNVLGLGSSQIASLRSQCSGQEGPIAPWRHDCSATQTEKTSPVAAGSAAWDHRARAPMQVPELRLRRPADPAVAGRTPERARLPADPRDRGLACRATWRQPVPIMPGNRRSGCSFPRRSQSRCARAPWVGRTATSRRSMDGSGPSASSGPAHGHREPGMARPRGLRRLPARQRKCPATTRVRLASRAGLGYLG